MLKKTLLILCFPVLVFAQEEKAMAVVEPASYNFGTINQGEIAEHDFIISNTGDDTLRILDAKASCGCTVVEPEKLSLAPGESTKLHVSFDSKGRTGKQTKMVYVKTNDPVQKVYKMKFEGRVAVDNADNIVENSASPAPKIFFAEEKHDFGIVQEGKVVDYVFKISNKGEANLKIKDVKTSCGCTAATLGDNMIQPGEEEKLKVQFDSNNRSGAVTRTITVTSNDPDQPVKTLTITAEVIKGK